MIKKVTITGDMVEVEAKVGDEILTVRRNVQGYKNYTSAEKRALWNDIVGLPYIDYKPNLVKQLFNRLRR